MTTKVSVYIATSIDGYIARKDGNLDWLDAASETVPKGEDCGYEKFMASIDCLVMGRNTFEKVLSFGIDWPYENKRVIALSSNPIEIPASISKSVSSSSASPRQLYDRLNSEGVKHVYLDGGITIQRFLQARLVDEMTITTIPILLGEGIPLFGSLENDVPLKIMESKSYDFGFVISKYVVEENIGL